MSGWDEANAVMPGAWRVAWVMDILGGGTDNGPNAFGARAVSIGRLPAGAVVAYGANPDEALSRLTQRLIEMRDGQR